MTRGANGDTPRDERTVRTVAKRMNWSVNGAIGTCSVYEAGSQCVNFDPCTNVD